MEGLTWVKAHDDVPPSDVNNINTLMDLGVDNRFGSSKDIADEAHEGSTCNNWEITLDSSIINRSGSYQLEGAIDGLSAAVSFNNVLPTQNSGDGKHQSVTEWLSNIEMAYTTQVQQVRETAMDDQGQQMASAHGYLLSNNFEDVSGLPQSGPRGHPKNPFEDN